MSWNVLGGIAVAICVWIWMSKRKKMTMPGPKGSLFLGIAKQLNPAHKAHVIITKWNEQYGSIMQIPLPAGDAVVLSDMESIYEITVKKGYEFGGRPHNFRNDIATQKTGILTSRNADDKWKFLRKITHRHLKQFGDGMTKLESVIEEVGADMFDVFQKNCGKPFDPNLVIFDAALNSIAFLITGERTRRGDPVVEKMRQYEDRFLQVTAPLVKWEHSIIDLFPFLRFLGLEIWTMIQDFVAFEQEIWTDIRQLNDANPSVNSLCKILMTKVVTIFSDSDAKSSISEKDARRTSMNLLLAGVTTTSNTFYGAINILGHHQEIQTKMFHEIQTYFSKGETVDLKHRPEMHYCRAFLLELLRYTSVVAMSVGHRAQVAETIQGYFVPKETRVIVNIYGLHHNRDFWIDPEVFKPERFLDENGEVVPSDHQNRKHLMPFGAGPRVCVGETLAMTRLFLWITTLVNRFHIDPAPGNTPASLDTSKFDLKGVLQPVHYEVILTEHAQL